MAMAKPTSVVINVCQEFSRIGPCHSHSDAKMADGAGSTNCGMANRRTAPSHSRNMAIVTTHGSARRTGLRSSSRLGRATTGISNVSVVAISCLYTVLPLRRLGARPADVLTQVMNQRHHLGL